MDSTIYNARRFRNLSKFYYIFIRQNFFLTDFGQESKVLLKKRSAIRAIFMPDKIVEFDRCLCSNKCVLIETCKTAPYIENGKWICCE